MKYIALLFLAATLIFTNCKKENDRDDDDEKKDRRKPQIELLGDSLIDLQLNVGYAEPGYVATDNVDGDLTDSVKVEGEVDSAVVGEHELVYTVEDKAGNKDTATRTIQIQADKLAGFYDVNEEPGFEYVAEVKVLSAWNKLSVSNFGGYGTHVYVDIEFDEGNIKVPAYTFNNALEGDITVEGTMGTYDGAGLTISSIAYSATFADGQVEEYTAIFSKKN